MLDAVFRKASILAAVPVRVREPVPELVTVTLPPELAVIVPAEAVRTTVMEPVVSTSARVTADRFRSEATSSVTVTSVGRPVTVGTSLTAVMSTVI